MSDVWTFLLEFAQAIAPILYLLFGVTLGFIIISSIVRSFSPRETAIAHPPANNVCRQAPETPETPVRKEPRMNLPLWLVLVLLFAGVIIGGIIQLIVRKIKADREAKSG